ncbi:phosphoenolpyruvate--protein phosphotransferase [soil metagenome]
MPREIRFDFPLPNGLHARPASHVQELASQFSSTVQITNLRSDAIANAKSVLSMVSADIRQNDALVISISGPDEDRAEAELQRFLRDVLPGCDDEPQETTAASRNNAPLPRSLRATGLTDHFRGTPVSGGIGIGKVVRAHARAVLEESNDDSPIDVPSEQSRFEAAQRAIQSAIASRIASSAHDKEIAVLRAHQAIATDVSLAQRVRELIERDHRSASQAVRAAAASFIDTLQNSTSAFVRERALDLQDVTGQLLDALAGRDRATTDAIKLNEPTICLAERLTPSQFLSLDRNLLKGLILGEAGTTSHTVILARSMNVPTLVDAHEVMSRLPAGQEIIIDANLGIVIPQITEPLRRYYQREQRTLAAMQEQLSGGNQSSVTLDGHELRVAANISSADEVAGAMARGASGIGLFRTEMLFMDRDAPPSEDQQFEIYSRAVRAADGSPVLIRLLDVGGDKPVKYLNLPAEANPFLGFRGVRIYQSHRELILTQLRAILRASEFGDVRILVPMIGSVEEMRAARSLVNEAREALNRPAIQIGAMIEVPSCAFIMEELCEEADFFSIGSNDLTQYFLAADRGNASVSNIYGWTHPSFLRLLSKIVARARGRKKHISLCGEMADDSRAWPVLLALRLDEISLSAPRIPTARRAIRKARVDDSADLLVKLLASATRADAEKLLAEYSSAGNQLPLLDRALVLNSDAASKFELIKQMSDALWLADRARDRFAVEEAIWLREETYSTGFGYGFALPHCKSDGVTANSIVIARLASPIDWGSNDGQPVDVVILLAMRASDYAKEHLRVFAQLSRMVMRDEFRDRIRAANDPSELLSFLKQSLGQVS